MGTQRVSITGGEDCDAPLTLHPAWPLVEERNVLGSGMMAGGWNRGGEQVFLGGGNTEQVVGRAEHLTSELCWIQQSPCSFAEPAYFRIGLPFIYP